MYIHSKHLTGHLALYLESRNTFTNWEQHSNTLFTLRITKPGKPPVAYRFQHSKCHFRKQGVTKLLKSRWSRWGRISTGRQVEIVFVYSCIKIKWRLIVLIKIHLATVHPRRVQKAWFYHRGLFLGWAPLWMTAPGNPEEEIQSRVPRAWLPGTGAAVTPSGQGGCLISDFSPATRGTALITTCCSFRPTANNLCRKQSFLELSLINRGGPSAVASPPHTNSSGRHQTLADLLIFFTTYYYFSNHSADTTAAGQT